MVQQRGIRAGLASGGRSVVSKHIISTYLMHMIVIVVELGSQASSSFSVKSIRDHHIVRQQQQSVMLVYVVVRPPVIHGRPWTTIPSNDNS